MVNLARWVGILFPFILLSVLFIPMNAQGSVLINEFSPDTSPQTVELYNNASMSADISGWFIDDDGGTTYYTIPQNTILYPQSCQVFSSGFNLNKSTPDTIRLFDNKAPPTTSDAHLIDSYSYKGSPGPSLSYARIPDGQNDWFTGTATFASYNANGLSCIIIPSPTPHPSPTPQQATAAPPSPTVSLVSYDHIYISEVMAYPESGQYEWIELYNNNEFEVCLNNWFLDDRENGGSAPKKLTLTLAPHGFGVLELSASMFNNDTDEVRLLDYGKTLKDTFEYAGVKQNNTYSRITWDSDAFCETHPSKNEANSACISLTSSSPASSAKASTLSSAKPVPPIKSSPHSTSAKASSSYVSSPALSYSPSVLGISTIHIPEKPSSGSRTIRHLSFLSLSYSILTIASLLIKIRNGL